MNVEEFFRSGDVVSVRFYMYEFAGGAHGNHNVTSLNFLGARYGQVELRALLDYDAEQKLFNYCKRVILAGFGEEGAEQSFVEFTEDETDLVWKVMSQFNIDERGLTVNFSPYAVLPYVFGVQEVMVPWPFVESLLAEPFKWLPRELGRR
jgi:hypothetical protein